MQPTLRILLRYFDINNITMQQRYPKTENCELVRAQPETIEFLLSYSRSLHVTKTRNIIIEQNKN